MKLSLPPKSRLFAAAAILGAAAVQASPDDDRRAVAELDTAYQAAVKRNDADAMARILHPQFVLVVGTGKAYNREDLLASARNADITYEQQDEEAGTQVVRVWGDTAVVTALLWIKGTRKGEALERRLWFSDTYVRTKDGWKYVFGQASLPLPGQRK